MDGRRSDAEKGANWGWASGGGGGLASSRAAFSCLLSHAVARATSFRPTGSIDRSRVDRSSPSSPSSPPFSAGSAEKEALDAAPPSAGGGAVS